MGKDGDELVPFTQALVEAVASYKLASSAVKALVPKAKSQSKPKGKAKAAASA